MNNRIRKQISSRCNYARGSLCAGLSVLTIAVLTLTWSDGLAQAEENRFGTEIAAVIAASNLYNPTSIAEDREYMGAVLRDGEQYLYTAGAGRQRRDKVTVKIEILTGFELVALWHTHGAAASGRKYFSQVDTDLAEKLQIPFYLADFTGQLKVFEPGTRTLSVLHAKRLGLTAAGGHAKGQKVMDDTGDVIRIKVKG
jgi:hypothetical protein